MFTSTWRARNRAVVIVIQATRKQESLTQQELVDRLPKWMKWDKSTLAKVETGRRRMDLVEFMELAKALKLTPEELIGRIDRWRDNKE